LTATPPAPDRERVEPSTALEAPVRMPRRHPVSIVFVAAPARRQPYAASPSDSARSPDH
jgi:hypothetical protein